MFVVKGGFFSSKQRSCNPGTQAKAPLILIELRTIPSGIKPPQWDGVIEICGHDTNGVYGHLDSFITKYS